MTRLPTLAPLFAPALAAILLFAALRAHALSADAAEFIAITKELEPVQCEKRKLRREIALAEAEQRDAKPLRARFATLPRCEDRAPGEAPWRARAAAEEFFSRGSSSPRRFSRRAVFASR